MRARSRTRANGRCKTSTERVRPANRPYSAASQPSAETTGAGPAAACREASITCGAVSGLKPIFGSWARNVVRSAGGEIRLEGEPVVEDGRVGWLAPLPLPAPPEPYGGKVVRSSSRGSGAVLGAPRKSGATVDCGSCFVWGATTVLCGKVDGLGALLLQPLAEEEGIGESSPVTVVPITGVEHPAQPDATGATADE